eukprot:jgi/Chrzof1/10936/Cz05g17240.t1
MPSVWVLVCALSWLCSSANYQAVACAGCSRQSCHSRRRLWIVAAKGDDTTDDKVDPKKADFSAYWSLKFREFFSKRRQYLELATKRQGPPPVLQKLDTRIEQQQEQLDEALHESQKAYEADQVLEQELQYIEQNLDKVEVDRQRAQQLADALLRPVSHILPGLARDVDVPPQTPTQIVYDDVDMARQHLQSTRVKLLTLTVHQIRDTLRMLVLLPFTLPAAFHAQWSALFASQRYENFLMAEGERIWYWRNRMENERWFWEVMFFDRFLVPTVWTLCYLAIVPNNLIWAVLVPLSFIMLQDRRLPSPVSLEFWLIAIFGLYGKCWDQVVGLAALLLKWW